MEVYATQIGQMVNEKINHFKWRFIHMVYTWSKHVYNLKCLYSGDIVKEKKKKSMKIMSQERIEKITQEKKNVRKLIITHWRFKNSNVKLFSFDRETAYFSSN